MKKDSPGKKNQGINYRHFLLPSIIVFSFLVYKASLQAEFLSYDDEQNIVNNILVNSFGWSTLLRIFTSAQLYMYTPVTHLSYALNVLLWGMDPVSFKTINLVIHLINILLVYKLLEHILKSRNLALWGALLFAVHPVMVDSVSWISSRNNLLAFLFFVLGFLCYLNFRQKKGMRFYFYALAVFVLSLLSKPSGILFPVFIWLYDFYFQPYRGWRSLIGKLPFLLLSFASGLATVYFRSDTALQEFGSEYTMVDKGVLLGYSYLIFGIRYLFPFWLSEIYAFPIKHAGTFNITIYAGCVAFMALVGLFLLKFKRLAYEIRFSVFFFILNLAVAVSAFLEDGYTANRYVYLPSLGLIILILSFLQAVNEKYYKIRSILMPGVVLLILIFSWETHERSLVWKDSLTLFNHAVEHSPESAFVYNNRGIVKYFKNDMQGALADYNEAIRLNTGYSGAYYNRGLVFYSLSEFKNAETDYSQAIQLNPAFASSYMSRGIVRFTQLGDTLSALNDYNMAIRINPEFAQAYYNRGLLKFKLRQPESACNDFFMVKQLGYPNADEIIEKFCGAYRK